MRSEQARVEDPVFEGDVYPILESVCQFCHSTGGDAEYSSFFMTGDVKADRARVVMLVSPDNPDDSLLLQRAIGNDHLGGPRMGMDSPGYVTIRNWIASLPPAP